MTAYDKIYSRFIGKIEDYDLLDDMNYNPTYFDNLVLSFLKSSIPKFIHCTKDLTDRDDELESFNFTLTELEQEILAIQMVLEYLSPNIVKDDYIKSKLGSKDYRQWSPANQMKEVRETKESIKNELNRLIKDYYYVQGIE